ncbi:hypothetical protein DL89DRAFT_122630 [Linderina pennispora]|uniref:Zn(2)-C6 fungal-type domain-containing protein n=1 Tax=Linderina pennispora TaxID=61395 RepID=A0A1Y1WCU6_9FUNG|nr:uncharacterized protein DL89DRAFT_122630 [Linderina pennispora]ORX71262.1 hypothetical protein DL89DRAFT_122630 [Linderina pennispora]
MSLQLNSAPLLHSCERCRQKKRKCSGDKPACTWCRKHNAICEYRQSIRIRKQLDALAPRWRQSDPMSRWQAGRVFAHSIDGAQQHHRSALGAISP